MQNDPTSVVPQHINDVFASATCLYSKQEVEAAFDTMAEEMRETLSSCNPIFLCVVLGGIVPLGNLLPRLDFPLELDYVHATRYQGNIIGQDLEWKRKPSARMKDRTVVVVDDILDSGVTLTAILQYCRAQGARAVYSAVLVNKHAARLPGCQEHADFSGLNVNNYYVFGYGMDYKGYLRNASGIYRVASEYTARLSRCEDLF